MISGIDLFRASTAAEDETDLDKVSCSMHLFEVYNGGFSERLSGTSLGCGNRNASNGGENDDL